MTPVSRQAEVRNYRAVDTLDSPVLKRATELVAALFDCPMSSINLIDDDTVWLLGRTGLDLCSSTRENAFCNLTIEQPVGGIMVIEDAAVDPRVRDNPNVIGEFGLRFYVGALLTSASGFNLGALCVLDTVPRPRPSEALLDQLTTIAQLVVSELERARSDLHLQQHQDMLNMAEARSGVGHWRMQLPSGQIFWSDEVYKIHGVDRETFDPQYGEAISFYAPEDGAILSAAIDATLAGQGPFQRELDLNRKDGSVRRVISKGACAFDAEGQPALLYGVFQDVTDQRAAIKAAEDATAVKGDFLANMSHELRTPLTSIIGFTDLMAAQSDLSQTTRDYLRRIDSAGRSLMCLVNDILDFSKLEAGQVAIRPEATDVEALCRDVLELFAPQIGAKDLSLDLCVTPNALTAEIDPDRVRQILLNLVGNAVKFTTSGRIVLSVEWDGALGRLQGSVSDTGPGMSPDQAAGLFQRFSQIDGSATRRAGGTGLGLAICKGLCEAMGGAIGVESRLGEGSRFFFEIEAGRIVATHSLAPSKPAAATGLVGVRLSGVEILVADDHSANRELARLFLTGFGGEVTLAEDGRAAVDLAAARKFDLILMDYRMPGMDGQQALHAIRSGGASKDAPVIAYTADAHAEDARSWRAKGFQGVVNKPLSSSELVMSVMAALDEPAMALNRPATG